jgi:Flp pilus assembly protein TadG
MSTLPHARAKARALALKLLPARFHRDERGVAAVEFALILPVLVLLYVGVVDITYAVTANRKVTQVTSAVADLTAQAFEVDNQDVQNIFRAANDIMRPYPTAGLQVAITVVDFDGSPSHRRSRPASLPRTRASSSSRSATTSRRRRASSCPTAKPIRASFSCVRAWAPRSCATGADASSVMTNCK